MIRAASCVICLLASQADATPDGWPALYDADSVPEDGALAIRAAPSQEAEILDTLPPDTTGIEILGADDRFLWGMVNTRERTGWVPLDFLARRPGQWIGRLPEPLSCFGTEPFWSLSVSSESVSIERPETVPLHFARTVTLRSRNRIGRHALVGENDLGGLVATAVNQSCSDGMSDRAYGWTIDIVLSVAGTANAQLYSGCCSLVTD